MSQDSVPLRECPPGLFEFQGALGFKSEYGDDAYCLDSGEFFWGGTADKESRARLLVRPIEDIQSVDLVRLPKMVAALRKLLNIRPANWDDTDDPESVEAWADAAEAFRP